MTTADIIALASIFSAIIGGALGAWVKGKSDGKVAETTAEVETQKIEVDYFKAIHEKQNALNNQLSDRIDRLQKRLTDIEAVYQHERDYTNILQDHIWKKLPPPPPNRPFPTPGTEATQNG